MIATNDSPLTFLQQRLAYVAAHPERDWTLIVDNVPQWPEAQRPGIFSAIVPEDVEDYAPCAGTTKLIGAVADRLASRWHVPVPGDSVLVTNGAMQAITLLARHFARPGRRALVQAPVLGAVPAILRQAGFHVEYFDPERLEDVTSRESDIALIYINSPNNPTGAVVSRQALVDLAALANRADAVLLCDQVYDDFGSLAAADISGDALLLSLTSPRVFYLNSMSKNFGLPGLRIGWLIGNAALVEVLSGQLERENVAVSGPSQAMAAAALRHGNDVLRSRVAATRQQWLSCLSTVGLTPEGGGNGDATDAAGSGLVLRLPVDDIEEFADELLSEHDLAVTTSSNFAGVPEDDRAWLRLPLGCSEETIGRAVAALVVALESTDRSIGAVHAYH